MIEVHITRMSPDELKHFGIKGQKWGIRRYENPDGTLTEAGKKRYSKSEKIASGEKISKEQMKKNALKRGAIGAAVGTVAGSIADSVSRKNSFMNSTTNGLGLKDQATASATGNYSFLNGFDARDMNSGSVGSTVTGGSLVNGKWKDKYSWYYPDVKFKNNGEAFHTLQRMTKSLLVAPTAGAAIGGSVGALGSIAVDKLHNSRIDRARKFVERYTSAYKKTVNKEDASKAEKQKDDVAIKKNKESFDRSVKSIKDKGTTSWFDEVRDTKDEDRFFDHVFDTQGKLLDRWNEERDSARSSDKRWDSLQAKYSRKLANNLGIPPTRENIEFIKAWFINGDD